MTQSKAFNHLTPALYDRYMGPLLFEPYARLLAERSAQDAVVALFREDPPEYMERGPFSYADPALIKDDLVAAGFNDIQLETVALLSRVSASDAAQGLVLGSPFRAEIERRDPSALDRAVKAVTEALRPWDGKDVSISAHVVTSTAD